ncbi:hypothetical protein [Novosphingobium album (ex Hu et al. 2023)]|uniref:DUF3618 domain-containing protein n=1 Tax=Novosphingobium album (ex Hu et al. 2023) TaxID=2930093 RepID=A0ABT0AXX3_9SPHN|nr:hypothetical protein [Novosphingobium album (ex Hu et al. 2023)]MCJ2177541.1 hypothetical protein [Novosphingobium album (ex Hu et al. 2023)]
MGKLADQVLSDRAARDAARTAFDTHYAALKADMEERGIAGRIADETMEHAKGMFDEAVAVAESHPGVIGGTIAALLLWLFRTTIISWGGQALEPLLDKVKELGSDQD